MTAPLFVDTGYAIALINRRDQHHAAAQRLAERFAARSLVTTDAVLLELGSALAYGFRAASVELIGHFIEAPDVEVVSLTDTLRSASLAFYAAHEDKPWSLTDCISFVVMRQRGLIEALAFDRHFEQAGFRALLRETSS
ncbi:MAG: PIN domain-containing protein [Bacteroidota bacterium]